MDEDLSDQALVEKDLEALVDDDAFYRAGTEEVKCLPISVPNHRAVPRLAFWLDIRPSDVISVAAEEQPQTGLFLAPAREFTIENFILDPGDETRTVTKPPPGFRKVTGNRSWILYSKCPGEGRTGYAPLSTGP